MIEIAKLSKLLRTVSPALAISADDIAKLSRFALCSALPIEHLAAIQKTTTSIVKILSSTSKQEQA